MCSTIKPPAFCSSIPAAGRASVLSALVRTIELPQRAQALVCSVLLFGLAFGGENPRAGFLAANAAGRRRLQADGFYFVGPLAIMVTARRWLAMMLLPSAAHLMNQILQNLRVGLPDKHIRIEPNSVATEVADPAGKLIGRK